MAETPKYPSPSWAPPPQKEGPKMPTPESTVTDIRQGYLKRVWNRNRWKNPQVK